MQTDANNNKSLIDMYFYFRKLAVALYKTVKFQTKLYTVHTGHFFRNSKPHSKTISRVGGNLAIAIGMYL